ncbi:MAG: hypothetical protein ABIK92_13785 [Pseudomonadota bacterium]
MADKMKVETGSNAFIMEASDDTMLLGLKLPKCPHPKGTMIKVSLAPEGAKDDGSLKGICCDGLCWSN